MAKKLPQEGLKLIACLSMLLDHIGATLVPGWGLRIVGRIAFPIYCFLLSEGAHYTKKPQKYALRLFLCALLSELPFDLALFGGWGWQHQSVMVTLLLGFGCLWTMEKCANGFLRCLVVVPFALAAEWLNTDYGLGGVLFIALFGLTREAPHRLALQALLMAALIWFVMPGARIPILGKRVPIEMFGLLALIPIGLYSGRKVTYSRAVQWAFYLFYPVHLGILYLLTLCL